MNPKGATKIIAALVLLGALIFLGDTGIMSLVRKGIIWAAKPVIGVNQGIKGVVTSASFGREEILSVVRENQKLKAALYESEKLRVENAALARALGLRNESGLKVRGAKVLMHVQEFGKEFLLIDQGRDAGIGKGDLVLDDNRVFIGRVEEPEKDFSKVTIASNPGEAQKIFLLPTKVKALAKGMGGRAFLLDLIPANTPVRKGDMVAMVESGGLQFLLGEVVSTDSGGNSAFQEARAVLTARPELLEVVFIIIK